MFSTGGGVFGSLRAQKIKRLKLLFKNSSHLFRLAAAAVATYPAGPLVASEINKFFRTYIYCRIFHVFVLCFVFVKNDVFHGFHNAFALFGKLVFLGKLGPRGPPAKLSV